MRNKAQTYIRADPGIAWGRGRCVHCPVVGGAMAVSVVAATDISRGFCERFFVIVGPWLDYEIRFSFFCKMRGDGQTPTVMATYFFIWGIAFSPLKWPRSKSRFSWGLKCCERKRSKCRESRRGIWCLEAGRCN